MKHKYSSPMAEEVRQIKEECRLNIETCAYISCVSQRTFARYLTGEASMNGLMWKMFKSEAKKVK